MAASGEDGADALYRRLAPSYDRHTARRIERYQRRAIQRLVLWSGDTVLDVACGTGLSFAPILSYIGRSGRLVGIDISAEMLSEAEARVQQAGWRNVTLIESAIEDADLPGSADAALFSFTHDVLQSKRAVENVVGSLKPGARVVAAGAKWVPWYAAPANAYIWYVSRKYVTTFDGFARPWRHLKEAVSGLTVEPAAFGGAYIASGTMGEVEPR